jgi:hypothetical protein
MATSLQKLAELGQSPWIDFLWRPFVREGELAGLIDDGIVGVASTRRSFRARSLRETPITSSCPHDFVLRGMSE